MCGSTAHIAHVQTERTRAELIKDSGECHLLALGDEAATADSCPHPQRPTVVPGERPVDVEIPAQTGLRESPSCSGCTAAGAAVRPRRSAWPARTSRPPPSLTGFIDEDVRTEPADVPVTVRVSRRAARTRRGQHQQRHRVHEPAGRHRPFDRRAGVIGGIGEELRPFTVLAVRRDEAHGPGEPIAQGGVGRLTRAIQSRATEERSPVRWPR